VGDVAVDEHVRTQFHRQRPHPLLERLALIGESKLGALGRHGARDAPRERALIGEAHDQPALALHQLAQISGPPVSSSTFTSSPGCGSWTSNSSVYGPV